MSIQESIDYFLNSDAVESTSVKHGKVLARHFSSPQVTDEQIKRLFFKELDCETGWPLYEVTPGNIVRFARALLAAAPLKRCKDGVLGCKCEDATQQPAPFIEQYMLSDAPKPARIIQWRQRTTGKNPWHDFAEGDDIEFYSRHANFEVRVLYAAAVAPQQPEPAVGVDVLKRMLSDTDALEGISEWLKEQELSINIGQVQGDFDEHIESSAGWLLRLVNAAMQAGEQS